MMETIKIQINHIEPLTLDMLAMTLYDEIGEEYNISKDEIKEYFAFDDCYLLAEDNGFVSLITFKIPTLNLRDFELKKIVFSFLDTLNALDNILSIIKIQDTILQKQAYEYYQQIIDIEMSMRNILTYILTYDDRRINADLFKEFGVAKSENIEHDKLGKIYENGLFYIYFNHYLEFSKPAKLKTEQIVEFLQEANVTTFEKFKEKLEKRAISEERHLAFLASIKEKIQPLEKMRNAIMHIRNLSDTTIRNYKKAITDDGLNLGLPSHFTLFWKEEKEVLQEQTLLALAKKYIQMICENVNYKDGILYVNEEYQNDIIESEYTTYDDFQDDIIAYYIVDEINIFEDELSENIADELDMLLCSYWNKITMNE